MDTISENSTLINLDNLLNIFNMVNNGVTIADKNSNILYTNPAFTKITGYTKEDVKGENPGMLHSGRHDKLFYQKMWQQIAENGFWEGEIWNRKKNGEIYPELLSITKIKKIGSDDFYYIAIFSDISFLKEDIEEKLHLAFYDPLTQLPNRNLYLDRVNQAIENARFTKHQMAVFFMDLDKFKQVNDTFGHCAGDELLTLVGKRLGSVIRAGDTIARIGGDEFTAILAAPCEEKFCQGIANRMVEAIEKPFLVDGNTVNVSISIGISIFPDDSHVSDDLLKKADQAMYVAKKNKLKVMRFNETCLLSK